MQYSEEYNEGGRRRYEMTIPILLLVLVFLVVAWKVGWLSQLPFIGSIFAGGTLNVLIIGEDVNIEASLSDMRQDLTINYDVMEMAEVENLLTADYLPQYDLLILTESLGTGPGDLPSIFRQYLAIYLSGNKKMLFFGVAGSTDPESANTDGWTQAGMDGFIPVTCQEKVTGTINVCDTTNTKVSHSQNMVTLKIKQINHAILKEFGTTVDFQTGASPTLEYTLVNMQSGTELATISVDAGGVTTASPGIIEYDYGLGGKVMYFAYHPSKTPVVFKNTMKYLMG